MLAVTHGAAEALALAKGLDVDPESFFALIDGGPLDMGYLRAKAGLILEDRLSPASFAVATAEKDARLIVEAGRTTASAWTSPPPVPSASAAPPTRATATRTWPPLLREFRQLSRPIPGQHDGAVPPYASRNRAVIAAGSRGGSTVSRPVWLSRIGLIAVTTVSAGALAAPAEAAATGVASVSGTKVTYKAARGKQNKVVVTRSGRTVTVDDRVAVKAGKGCKAVKGDRTRVRCTTAKATTKLYVYTYDRNDSVVNKAALRSVIDGGTAADRLTGGSLADSIIGRSGNDKIWGGAGHDLLSGGDGNDAIDGQAGGDYLNGDAGQDSLYGGAGFDADHLSGGWGNDTARGGAGNDELRGDAGRDRLLGEAGDDIMTGDDADAVFADTMIGGAGRDTVEYMFRTAAVTVDLDGAGGDDGQKGERDTVGSDVEVLYGGAGNDRLTGNAAANWIYGREGGDVVRGGGGDDSLFGDSGADRLFGDAGNDALFDQGDTRADRLDGGANADQCFSDAGEDTAVSCEN